MFTEKIKKQKRETSSTELVSRSSEKQKSEMKKRRKGLSLKEKRFILKGMDALTYKNELKGNSGSKVFLIPTDAGEISGKSKQAKRHTLAHKKALKRSLHELSKEKGRILDPEYNPINKSSTPEEKIEKIEKQRHFEYKLLKQTEDKEARIKKKNNPKIKGISPSGKKNRRKRKLFGKEDQDIRKIWKRAHDIVTKKKVESDSNKANIKTEKRE